MHQSLTCQIENLLLESADQPVDLGLQASMAFPRLGKVGSDDAAARAGARKCSERDALLLGETAGERLHTDIIGDVGRQQSGIEPQPAFRQPVGGVIA